MIPNWELWDKDFKAVIIKMIQQVIMNILEANKRTESLSKEIEDLKKQTEGSELKSTIKEAKNSKDECKSRT